MGSSQTTSSGWQAKARAMATRWRSPPLTWAGKRSRCRAPRPTARRSSAARPGGSRRPPGRRAASGRATASRIVRRAFSVRSGFWKTIWSRRAGGRVATRRGDAGRAGRPAGALPPSAGAARPDSGPGVVLPEPLSPTTASVSPGTTARATPSRARAGGWPGTRPSRRPPRPYWWTRSRASSQGAATAAGDPPAGARPGTCRRRGPAPGRRRSSATALGPGHHEGRALPAQRASARRSAVRTGTPPGPGRVGQEAGDGRQQAAAAGRSSAGRHSRSARV